MSKSVSRDVVWTLLVLIALAGTFVAWEYTADDSFITFRYSKNLAEGNGLVWNPNSPNPVEGYTNFLWMLLMVIPHAVSISPVLFSKLIGMAALLACFVTAYVYGCRRIGGHWWGIAVLAPLVILPASYFHALAGLETALFALLLLVLFIIGLESLTTGPSLPAKYLWMTPLVVLLAGMTRPEGLLPGSVVLIALLISLNKAGRLRLARHTGALLVVPGLAYFLWRFIYFGWPLPNTFYVKFGGIYHGLLWLLNSTGLIAGILVLFLLALRCRDSSIRLSRTSLFMIAFLAITVLPYCLSDLWANYMDRFLYHLMPVIFLVLALSLKAVFGTLPRGHHSKSGLDWCRALTFCACLVGLLYANKQEVAHLGLATSHLEHAHVALADALRESDTPSELRTITVGDVGALPYYADWHTYDYIGLTDESVAHNWSEKSQYIADRRPTVMVLYSRDGREPEGFQFGFDPQGMFPDYETIAYVRWFPNYYLGVFLSKDIPEPVFADLSRRIKAVSQSAEIMNAAKDDRAGLLARFRERVETYPVLGLILN